jgi:hypothetical protein
MNNTVINTDVNIEDLKNVLGSIQESISTPSIQELTNELETIAIKQNVTTDELYDLAEISQLNYTVCSRVLELAHQIKKFKSKWQKG